METEASGATSSTTRTSPMTTPSSGGGSTTALQLAPPPSSQETPHQYHSKVDIALGDFIAEGGFCAIYELLSIRDLQSGEYIVQEEACSTSTSASTSTGTAKPKSSSSLLLPGNKQKHKRGGSLAFGSFAGLVTAAAAAGGGGGSTSAAHPGHRHKRGSSSPAGLTSLPPVMKAATLTVVAEFATSTKNTTNDNDDSSQNNATTEPPATPTHQRRPSFIRRSSRKPPPSPEDPPPQKPQLLQLQEPNYVLKFLKPKTFANPQMLELGLKDMDIEIKMLQRLRHPQIVAMKAYGTIVLESYGSSRHVFKNNRGSHHSNNSNTSNADSSNHQYNTVDSGAAGEGDTPTVITTTTANIASYPYVVLDRLGETLEDKLAYWREKHHTRSSLVGKMITHRHHSKSTFYMQERLQVLCDIASALDFLHSKRIIYRDLKTDNVAFDRYHNNHQLKLIDFGLAKDIAGLKPNKNGLYHLTGLTGSARYMAPEVARKAPYNEKSDVYGLAIVMWQVMALEIPYAKFNVHKMFQQVYDCPHVRPSLVEWQEDTADDPQQYEWLVELLSRMWNPLIEERPSMRSVHAKLKHQLEKHQQQQQQQQRQQEQEE